MLAKFDLQNDVIAAGPFADGAGTRGAAVVPSNSQIPALSPLTLTLLGIILAFFAVIRLRM
jgi:hypothetical protein